MGKIVEVPPKACQIVPWGPGVMDIREFGFRGLKLDDEVEALRKQMANSLYEAPYMSMKNAIESIRLTVEAAPPGVIFASNPLYGDYAKWCIALVKAGFKQIGTCAVNPVYCKTGWDWKGTSYTKKHQSGYEPKPQAAYESQDGFNHWIHAFYLVKEGAKEFGIDLSKRGELGGDHANSRFMVNYAAIPGIPRPPEGIYEPNYARLSRNCGAAMGKDLPKKDVHKYYFTVGAFPADKLLPKGWTRFLVLGDLKFAHNCKSNPHAQPTCPHKLSEF